MRTEFNHLPIEFLPVILQKVEAVESELSTLLGIPVIVRLQLKPIEANEIMLQTLVCSVFNVSWASIVSKTRKREVVDARHAYCYLAYIYLSRKHKVTAAELGKRDRTTIYDNIKVAEDLLETLHQPFTNNIHQIIEAFTNNEKV